MDIKYGRKRSGIEKALRKKIEDWIMSIDDIEVQTLARRDTILMGGAIASMLLGEKVNDYDVYFKTKETALKVAEYYCSKFCALNNLETGEDVNDYSPFAKESVKKNCKGVEEERVEIFIRSAGVAGENPEKYEYFEQEGAGDQEEFLDSVINHDEGGEKYRPVFLSQNAISLSHKMQIVIRFFGDPEKVFESYDFVHAMNYYDYKKDELMLNPESLESLLSRTLIYRGSLYPIASIWRMKKFINRGWRISAGQQLKIMWQISELDLNDRSVIQEQLTGVDAAYLYQLIGAIDNAPEDTDIDSTYVATLIDKIFGE